MPGQETGSWAGQFSVVPATGQGTHWPPAGAGVGGAGVGGAGVRGAGVGGAGVGGAGVGEAGV